MLHTGQPGVGARFFLNCRSLLPRPGLALAGRKGPCEPKGDQKEEVSGLRETVGGSVGDSNMKRNSSEQNLEFPVQCCLGKLA